VTSSDEDRLLAKLAVLIDAKLAPVVKRIAALENVDRKHDAGLRDTRRELVQSKHDITETTNDSLLAASRHIAASVEHVRAEVARVAEAQTKSVAPAAIGAERAAHRTEGKTDALTVSAEQIEAKTDRALRWYRHPAFTAIINAIVGAVLGYVAHRF